MAMRHALLLLFPLILFSAPLDFKSCQLKYQVSSIPLDNTQALAVDDEYAIFYSKEEPSYPIIKRDPFLGLNLIKSPRQFRHIFKFYNNQPKHLAGVLPNAVYEGNFVRQQIGLNHLAKFSKKLKVNSLITGTCCGVMGLSTDSGVIDKDYIHHFLESEKIVYGDIGIRLADREGVRVVEVNPFFADSPFLLSDMILSMDGKKAENAAQMSKKILFCAPGSKHHFLILRGDEKITIEATLQKRLSGGLVPDSFFDLFGLELDENLIVKSDNAKYEIKKGDKLLFVMGKEVKTLADIRKVLSQQKSSKEEMVLLLFKRNGFDFFIHFPK